MKLIVNAHKIELQKTPVNENEIDITKCEFEFADEITNEFVKEAYFTLNGETYKEIIVNNECAIPNEVLVKSGTVEVGVVAYLVESEEEIKRYNPSPAYFDTWVGSLKADAENSQPITPSEMEQFEQALEDGLQEVANVNIDAEKVGNVATITITDRSGTTKSVEVYDGQDGQDGKDGKDGEQGPQGPQGPAGAIKMQVVNSLPASGSSDTIYLVPFQGETGNVYEEYIYVNGAWEKIGGSVSIDLSDYVKNTNYATSSKGGVIKSGYYGLQIDSTTGKAYCDTYAYSTYSDTDNQRFISKGTLENVITGKELTDKQYVDSNANPIVITSSASTYTIDSLTGNKTYKLGTITALTISAITTFDKESIIYFNSGSTATSVSIPNTLVNLGDVPTLTASGSANVGTCETNKSYIISIMNNIAVWKAY